MKKALSLILLMINVIYMVDAQNKLNSGEISYLSQVQDSDGIKSSDYYSGKIAVRTGLEVYNVFSGYYCISLNNSQNEIVGIGGRIQKFPIYKKTGEEASLDYMCCLTFDRSIMNEIAKEVFPKCEISDVETDNEIELYVSINMDTYKVIDMAIALSYSENSHSLLAIPPSKIKQLERLVKERCKGQFHERDLVNPIYTERTRNASYSIARYSIYFSKFGL